MSIVLPPAGVSSKGSGVHTTKTLAEAALQRIGAFPSSMEAADPVELHRALFWMDMAVALLAETEECWWLKPRTISQALSATVDRYTLNQFSNYPSQGILYPSRAYLSDGTNDEPIELVRRDTYDEIQNKATAGPPDLVFIDRLSDNKNVYVYPVPSAAGHSLKLVCQMYAPDMRGGQGALQGNVNHGFSMGWQMWLVKATAFEISGGAVRKLGVPERKEIQVERDTAMGSLMAFSNREKRSGPARTQPWGRC